MNPNVVRAVDGLVELINDNIGTEDEFIPAEIRIKQYESSHGDKWIVSAHRGKEAFKYAMYVEDANIVCDGY